MQHSQVYKEFYELHRDTYESIIRFFEVHRTSIRLLPLDEQLELNWQYLNACFQTARYEEYNREVDSFVEQLIIDQIDSDYGKEVYVDALFKKAASLYNLSQYVRAEHVVRQVCALRPDRQESRLLYRHCLYRTLSHHYRLIRHAAGISILLSALMTGVLLGLEGRVDNDLLTQFSLGRSTLFVVAMTSLVYIEARIRWLVYKVGRGDG